MDEQPTIFVGIDVSKDRLDVHLRPLDEAFHVPRDAKGLEALARRFGNFPVALVVLEATGGFEASVACPSSDDLRRVGKLRNGGSGPSGLRG